MSSNVLPSSKFADERFGGRSSNQADQLTASLSQQLAGEHAAAAVEVLQKVVEAKTTLMDPAAKASYDQQLSGGASAILSSNSGGEKPLPRRPAVAGGEI